MLIDIEVKMGRFNLIKAIEEVVSLPREYFEEGKALLIDIALSNGVSEERLVEALEDFILAEEYHEFLEEMEDVLENLVETDLAGASRIVRPLPPPQWIASGGSPSIRLWHMAIQKSMNQIGKLNYHKAISTWKDLEASFHKKDRLAKVAGVPMEDLVKKRFKDDQENHVNFYLFARKAYPELKAVYEDGELADDHPSIVYLSNVGRQYMGLTRRNLYYRMISKAVDEDKATQLNASEVGKYTGGDRDWVGVKISSNYLEEFTKRTYYASKYYKSNKASNKNLKTEHLL